MLIEMLKSKIHRATVTFGDLNYTGSITIDAALMQRAGLIEYEKVCVANISNGARFETYVITGDAGSGTIGLNGAAARLAEVGDKIIIFSFISLTREEAALFKPTIVYVDDNNAVTRVRNTRLNGVTMTDIHTE